MGFAELVEAAHQASSDGDRLALSLVSTTPTEGISECVESFSDANTAADLQAARKKRKMKSIVHKGDLGSTTAGESTLSECIDSFSDANTTKKSRRETLERDFLDYAPLQVEYKYKCKTCNKSFPNPRALGGHRSSHAYNQIKEGLIRSNQNQDVGGDHRCKICNKSFPTGQALGGHQRLHWDGFQASAAKRLLPVEMDCRKMLDNSRSDDQTGGEDGINLELTL